MSKTAHRKGYDLICGALYVAALILKPELRANIVCQNLTDFLRPCSRHLYKQLKSSVKPYQVVVPCRCALHLN